MKPRYPWQRLKRVTTFKPPAEDLITLTMSQFNIDRDEAIERLENDRDEIWVNDLYQVAVHELQNGGVQLNIRRRDGGPILRDWRHFQAIKNELIGEECEAVELYPAESRKVDLANKFHLWGVRDPAYRFPFGWTERAVDYDDKGTTTNGMKQRPL